MTDSGAYSDPVTTDQTTATPPPDPSGGLGLSDEANAALYPDVEHPDPEVLPPDAFQVPLPIEQRESPLLDIVRAYATGQADWPTTKQALVDFPYAQNPPVAGSPLSTSGSQGEWWADVEANVGVASDDNTWGQLQEAKNAGMLTRDEFNQVLTEKASRGKQTEQDKAGGGGDPKPGEGKAVPFDPAKHPHGAHGRWATRLDAAKRVMSQRSGFPLDQTQVGDLKEGDVIVHPDKGPAVVTQNLAHPRKVDPHMQWRSLTVHDGEQEHTVEKIHQGDHVDRLVLPPEMSQHPTSDTLRPYIGHHVTLTQSGYHTGSTAMPVRDPITGTLDRIETRDDPAALGRPTKHAVVRDVDGKEQSMRVTEVGSVKMTQHPGTPFRLGVASQREVADVLDDRSAKAHAVADRVHVAHGTTELAYDRVPSGPREGQWHGSYVTEYGNTRGDHPHGQVTDERLIKHLERARDTYAMGRVHDQFRDFAAKHGSVYSTQPALDKAAYAVMHVRQGMEQDNPPHGVRYAWDSIQPHLDAAHEALGKDKMAADPLGGQTPAEIRRERQEAFAKMRGDAAAIVDHYAAH